MNITQNRYYSLETADGQKIGDYAAFDCRQKVEQLANGRDWGWRRSAAGVEAVCEHEVIARAVLLYA